MAVDVPDEGGGDTPLEQPGAPTFTPDPTPAAPQGDPPAPAPDKITTLREKLAKSREAREQKAAQDQQAARSKELEARIAELQGKPSYEAFVEEFKRNPIATAKKVGMNPRQLLDQLTQDALAPGSVAAAAQAQDADAAGKSAHERMDRWEAEQRARAETERLQQNARDYVAATAPSSDPASPAKYPLLSKLPEARRLRLAQMAWDDLRAEGHAYDGELVAEYVEAQLADDHKHWSPPASPPAAATTAPSSQTSAAQPSRAATKQPPKTLTPEITGASVAAAQPRTKAERRKALESRLVPVETDH